MQLATLKRFHGEWYTDYRHHEGFARRAQLLAGFPEPLLIVGCGPGYTVADLNRLGRNVTGIDASHWAVERRVSDRVHLANILNPQTATRFATVITEDLLPCLTDDEARLAALNCASLAPIVIHLVTEQGQADLNYHSTGYWMNLTNQLTVSLEGM